MERVLFLSGNILKLDASPIKIYDLLSRVSPTLDQCTLINFVELPLYIRKFAQRRLIKQMLGGPDLEVITLPRIPFFSTIYVLFVINRKKIRVIHAIGQFAVALGAVAKFISRRRLIADLAGLVPDERVEAGIWKRNSLRYRVSKVIEKKSLEFCDHVIVVSNVFRDYLLGRYNVSSIEVIPSLVNENRFRFDFGKRESTRKKLKVEGKTVVVFSGSLAPWDLSSEIVRFFRRLRNRVKDVHFLVLTQNRERILELITDSGLDENDFTIMGLSFRDVPDYLLAGDIALLFRDNSLVHRAGSPMKFAEYLACGLPIIGSDGLGELSQVLVDRNAGVIIDFRNLAQADELVDELLASLRKDAQGVRTNCIDLATNEFSYKKYLYRYLRLYGDESSRQSEDRPWN